MKYKFYYYDEIKKCLLSNSIESQPALNEMSNDDSSIKIDVDGKNVENLYNFFKNNTLQQILEAEPQKIEIDFTEIEGLDFYNTDSFQKLVNLIASTLDSCNNTISQINQISVESKIDAVNESVE